MIDEGYIKFNCEWIQTEALIKENLDDLNNWRDRLYSLQLIGAYDNGIGFGNISQRTVKNQFIVSGSATGNLEKLDAKHYSKVIDYSIKKNSLICEGPVKASSESLTHASIYENDPSVKAVIHIHHLELWNHLKDAIPTTRKEVPYGTPEMAYEIDRLFKMTNVRDQKIIAMAGHEEGIISFGKNLKEAGEILLSYYNNH